MNGLRLRSGAPERPDAPSAMALRDLLGEALMGVLQRPARSALTAVGTVLGVGAFLAVLGLTGTAASQIDGRFNALTATQVTVEDTGGQDADRVPIAFPDDADRRVAALGGARAAGVYWKVRLGPGQTVRSSPVQSGLGDGYEVVSASPGLLEAVGPSLAQGRTFDGFHDSEHQRVAVIGKAAAARLGITTLETGPAIFVGDTAFTVIGILQDVDRKPDLLSAVLIPRSTAERIWGTPRDERAHMLVSTRLGAANQIADQAALALSPAHPEYFRTIPPPDPRALRSGVGQDLGRLFYVLAVVCLVIGGVGIANTTLVAVMERTSEIGLRRALGARGPHITGQFLVESAVLGLLGGLAGTALGTLTIVSVSAVQHWTPVLDTTAVVAAPLLGLMTGLLAGIYPAWRASHVQPADALRR